MLHAIGTAMTTSGVRAGMIVERFGTDDRLPVDKVIPVEGGVCFIVGCRARSFPYSELFTLRGYFNP